MAEAEFLRAIAENNDDLTRLVLADWLEERGETSRAEFIRVQCELESSDLPADRRHVLRLRERELLDMHRQVWIKAFELSLEDVVFRRGLIAGLRLSQWEDGRLLDALCGPRFATIEELDLSGLAIGDVGVATIAKNARFPALRKLILSNNGITSAGDIALAKSKGLPRLETLYLFENVLNSPFEGKSHLNLDLGEVDEGYAMSPGQADIARRQYVREQLLPAVARYFQTYSLLQSAMLCVAQYWDDEADDAVHGVLVVSELFEPTLEGLGLGEDASDPNVPNSPIHSDFGDPSIIHPYFAQIPWDDNYDAIPLWAAFAPEGGSQEYELLKKSYAPAVMFYRHGGYEILPMIRPQLDGIRPESNE